MNKSLAFILILSINLAGLFFFVQGHLPQTDEKGPIPENAIRLRILASSDSPADQTVKRQVRDAVNGDISRWVKNLKTEKQAQQVIQSHMPELRRTVEQTLRRVHADGTYRMELGQADFPTKMYGGYVYPAGKYKALVITLGDGKGANWWCVLFPPLCFLDFSNSEAVPDKSAASQTSINEEAAAERGADQTQISEDAAEQEKVSDDSVKRKTDAKETADDHGKNATDGEKKEKDEVEVRSFVADIFTKLWQWTEK